MPQQQGGYNMQPSFGGFINDPTAQLGFQMGKSAMDAGQQYMEQNVSYKPISGCTCQRLHMSINGLDESTANDPPARSLRLRLGTEALLQCNKLLRP